MKKRLISIVFPIMFIVLGITGTVFSDTLVNTLFDNYLHPLDRNLSQRPLDIIGTNLFDITKIEVWSLTAGGVRIDIFTAGMLSPSWYVGDAAIGDLFVDTNLDGKINVAVALRDHGTPSVTHNISIENGDGILKGNVFNPNATAGGFRLSDAYYFNEDFSQYGDNEIATAFGPVTGSATVVYNGTGKISVTSANNFGATNINDLRFRLGYTCNNDIMDNIVPEPATMLLLGSGLLGLAGFARRRFRKN